VKYIIFSDVHSNLEALQTFLTSTDNEIDSIRLCLGDMVGYGSSPNECLDLVHERDIPVVMGNHDYALIDDGSEKQTFNWLAREAIEWQSTIIRQDNLERIRKYPFVQKIDSMVSICHSSFHYPSEFIYLFSPNQARASFSELKTHIGFFGHTHLPTVFVEHDSSDSYNSVTTEFVKGDNHVIQLNSEKRYLINPGSIGQPRDGDSRASFVILDTEKQSCTFRRMLYDSETESQRMLNLNLPETLARRILIGQ